MAIILIFEAQIVRYSAGQKWQKKYPLKKEIITGLKRATGSLPLNTCSKGATAAKVAAGTAHMDSTQKQAATNKLVSA